MPGDPAALLDAIARDLRDHLPCESEPCATCTQLVPGEGDAIADVVLVGEAPGAKEDLSGRPFVGASGALLDEVLAEAGLDRGAVFITNVVKARPPGNRDPKPDEVRHHWPWLEAQLAAIEPKLLVPLGRHALGDVLTDGLHSITSYRIGPNGSLSFVGATGGLPAGDVSVASS